MKILVIGDFHGKFPEKLRKKIKEDKIDLVVSVGDYSGIEDWRPIIMKRLAAARKGKRVPKPEEIVGKEKFKKLLDKDFEAGRDVLKILDDFHKPVFLIFGNGDDEWYKYPFDKDVNFVKKRNLNFLKELKNIKVITYNKINFKDITFVGFGGYMDIDAYFDMIETHSSKKSKNLKKRINRREKSKWKLRNLLKKTLKKNIFVFHYPPKGFFDIIKDKKDNPMNGKSAGINFFTEAIKKYKPELVLCGHMHEYQGVKKLGKTFLLNPGAAVDGKAAIVDLDEKRGKVKNVRFLS